MALQHTSIGQRWRASKVSVYTPSCQRGLLDIQETELKPSMPDVTLVIAHQKLCSTITQVDIMSYCMPVQVLILCSYEEGGLLEPP